MTAPDKTPDKTPDLGREAEAMSADSMREPGEPRRIVDGDEYVRIDLWSAGLRFQHWASVLLIVVMSATGWYIMDPFFGPDAASAAASGETGYLMGIIRTIHITAGFLWCGVALARLFMLFFARGKQSRWKALSPFHSKADLKGLWDVTLYYAFLKKHAPLYIAHNPLQQLSYTGIYVMCLLQLLTGLALYGLYDQSNWFLMVLSYPIHWFGIPIIRLVHAVLMFLIWVFVVIHVYLAVRSDVVEKHGGISSMINGGMWLHRDAKPVDGERVGPPEKADRKGRRFRWARANRWTAK